MFLFGPPNVQKLSAKRDVQGLIKALGYEKDEQIRHAAALALGQIGDPRAVEPLIAALKDSKWAVRQAAAKALSRFGVEAEESLIAALKDSDDYVRVYAAGLLGDIAERRALSGHFSGIGILDQQPLKFEVEAAEPLIAALRDREPSVRQAAARALGQTGHAWAAEPLAAAVKDNNEHVRQTAIEALGRVPGAQAVKPLIAILKDSDAQVRRAAAEGLAAAGWKPDASEAGAWYWMARGELGLCAGVGACALEPLLAALHDSGLKVRRAAAEGLDAVGWQPDTSETGAWYWMAKGEWDQCARLGAQALAPLTSALKDKDAIVRAGATRALGGIGDARAVGPLTAALKDDAPVVHDAAVEVLETIGWKPDASAAGAWYWLVKRDVERCAQCGAQAVEPLIAGLTHWDKGVCRAAATALGQIGAPAREPLLTALKDGNQRLRKGAAEALGQMADARVVEPLLAALNDFETGVRGAAAEALGRTRDVRVVEPLLAALEKDEPWVRRAAAVALGQIGDARALQALLAASHDSDPDVRQAAVEALGQVRADGPSRR